MEGDAKSMEISTTTESTTESMKEPDSEEEDEDYTPDSNSESSSDSEISDVEMDINGTEVQFLAKERKAYKKMTKISKKTNKKGLNVKKLKTFVMKPLNGQDPTEKDLPISSNQ